ncbi:hypothetical protein [Nitrosomonas communis]|uniref:hypothetical protein n=1 Tax=Nitrosomonas communis TaxID=44574 RepID=UPI003D2E6F86
MSEKRRFTHAEMADEITKLVWSKQTWLDTFSSGAKRRPEHDIETRQLELQVLQQAEADYRQAAERTSG